MRCNKKVLHLSKIKTITNKKYIEMATFRRVNLEIKKVGYGQFEISSTYKGSDITVHTNNSECFDYLDDDSNKEKHQEAKRYAYNRIVTAYNNQ